MRNEYRNAMRSKILIKNAYIELLKQKPATKITVTDIIHTANISRGTFYAHYKDTIDLWESFQRDFLNQLIHFTNKHQEELLVNKIDLLLNKTMDILKSLIKEYSVSEEVQRSLNIYIGGFIMLLREWLENPNFESMEEYTKHCLDLSIRGLLFNKILLLLLFKVYNI